jgi:glycosyltransferase involved in cell wall biosynthesis
VARLVATGDALFHTSRRVPVSKKAYSLAAYGQETLTMKNKFGVSVVVPVYNNADVLPLTIKRLDDFFSSEFVRYEIIFVDDGSDDESWPLLQEAAAHNAKIRLLRHEKNLDQQQAVADGSLAAREDIIVNVDAHVSCPVTDLKKIALIAHQGTELVFGRRVGGPPQAWWRRFGTRFVGWLFRMLYSYPMSDFGCSIGAVRRSLVDRMRQNQSSVRIWLLKVELLRYATSYTEVDIWPPEVPLPRKSSYTILKLAKRFWAIIWYKITR